MAIFPGDISRLASGVKEAAATIAKALDKNTDAVKAQTKAFEKLTSAYERANRPEAGSTAPDRIVMPTEDEIDESTKTAQRARTAFERYQQGQL